LLIYLRNNIVDGLAQKRRYTNQSANGAQYDSQGQARSASPLVCNDCNLTRPERPEYDRYHTLSRSTWAVYLLPRASASASPLVCDNCKLTRAERPKYNRYCPLSGLYRLFFCYPGATRSALAPGLR